MKTFFKSILAVAVCASLFAACSKDDTVSDPSNGRKVTMTVTASSELESASGSRTTYDPLTGKVSWNATGEFLQVLETAASTTVFATSQKGVISGNIAKFAVTFPANENTPLVYNAVYPASAWVTSSNTDITNMKVITPTVQQPTATSFDSNADLLIAKSISLKSQPTELQMSFGRAVAIGKMTVKNLASAESVLGVKFTAPDKKVTGRSYVDMTAGTIKEYGYINNFADNVTLNYSSEMNITANSEAGMTAYFTCFPFEVAAGETFTVTVTTASKIFTKTVTVQEGRTLAFAAGDSSTFAVDMTGAGVAFSLEKTPINKSLFILWSDTNTTGRAGLLLPNSDIAFSSLPALSTDSFVEFSAQANIKTSSVLPHDKNGKFTSVAYFAPSDFTV